ncbi:DUF5047 domain-containing protein [Rhodococcus sp. 11-3]|uniref:DUF5047 domain-containing protein n=1 Tax=Rhodococcus sp. 11-3 TaxID=2854796 RepID=UPI00203B6CC6|nr:DUF5047 domain-containing protein [Rhodococcus sp. 11-3]USC17044.1 DUF5047 domain-containing protein [Rhodococcus sp. 11-3]
MGRATERFNQAVRRSHTVVSYVDVVSATQETTRLIAVSGDVSVDRTAAIRRGCRVECVDPLGQFTPKQAADLLTPYGTEIRPYRGIRYKDGTEEIHPLGVFRVSDVRAQVTTSGVKINITAFDRSRTVKRDAFTNIYTIAKGANIVDAIKKIIQRTFPDAEFDAVSSGMVTSAPKVYDVMDDPWEAATELAESLGCELYFDVEGIVVLAPPVDIDALPAPDFTYVEGVGCTMLDLTRQWQDEPGNNGVIVTGASPGDDKPPVRGEAWDMEPSSPTYRYSPYGEVPMQVSDNNVKTTAEANAMAASLLRGMLGAPAQLAITSWVHPGLEAGDIVEVVQSDLGVNGLYSIDSMSVPLRADGTQNIVVRQKRVIS